MIAKNYIKYPEALRFQCEMFSNGYKNSPRIMRLMTVIFDWKVEAPQWMKDAQAKAKEMVRAWKNLQLEMFETMKKKTRTTWHQLTLVLFPPYDEPDYWNETKTITSEKPKANAKTLEDHIHSDRWTPNRDTYTVGLYRSYCRAHQGGFQGSPKRAGHATGYSFNHSGVN